ncbi:MAG: anthrone oxygenase family protein [Pseudomonadota bacterium]|nr:anthrone oxygenase family protein [Pseudomonadota bacterium]
MGFFEITLIVAAFLCSLVAGFLFAFAVVIMPGINKLDDRAFIRAFQVMDGIIQKNQPLFILVWAGSVVVLIVSSALGIGQLDNIGNGLIIISALIYIIGVQLPTGIINIPLNKMLQSVDVDAMDAAGHKAARESFEPRWNRWNNIRTVLACLVSVLLILLVFRI